MKKRFLWLVLVVTLLLASAAPGHAQEPTATPLPGGARGSAQAEQPGDPQTDESLLSDLYDPSIFIIEASGAWRQELAEGYYADYECELYLDKADANDNRVADGLYTGVFWMSTKVEISDFLKKLLKDAPVAMDFDAGGEGICDNLTVHLLTEYQQNASQGYAIPGEKGETQPPKGALAAEGGFVAIAMDAYLNVQASGAQGESLQHSDSQAADAEMSYVIHVEPDPKNELAERKATIYLYNSTGMSVTLEGTWRRIPGYSEDMLEHANNNPARQMLDKHMP